MDYLKPDGNKIMDIRGYTAINKPAWEKVFLKQANICMRKTDQ